MQTQANDLSDHDLGRDNSRNRSHAKMVLVTWYNLYIFSKRRLPIYCVLFGKVERLS